MKRSIYKRKRNGRRDRKWTIAYELKNGTIKAETAYTDKQASEQLLCQREQEVAQGIVGLADPYREHKRRPIAEHVADYGHQQAGDGVSRPTIERCRNRLTKAFSAMQVRTIADLTIDKAKTYIADLVALEGLSLTTRNHHAGTLSHFGQFLADRDRLPRNPLEKLDQVKVTDADRTHEARVFTVDELMLLCDVAPSSRRLTYLFTAYTGLRHGEDAAVTWADLSIDTEKPTVILRDTKNGDTVIVGIPGWLAGELRKHRAEQKLMLGGKLPATRKVLNIPKKMVRHLRRDAAKAGLGEVRLEYRVSEGGHRYLNTVEWIDPANPKVRLDFHDLRAFYATLLFEQGVPVHEVQRLCRHASVQTTSKHYTAWRQSRLRDHVDAIPDPFAAGPMSVPASVDPSPDQSAAGRSGPEAPTRPRRASS